MKTVNVKFWFGDRVFIDGCSSVVGIITGCRFFNDGAPEYHVEWWVDGKLNKDTIDEFRLKGLSP